MRLISEREHFNLLHILGDLSLFLPNFAEFRGGGTLPPSPLPTPPVCKQKYNWDIILIKLTSSGALAKTN